MTLALGNYSPEDVILADIHVAVSILSWKYQLENYLLTHLLDHALYGANLLSIEMLTTYN
jgi:hypothetical protein